MKEVNQTSKVERCPYKAPRLIQSSKRIAGSKLFSGLPGLLLPGLRQRIAGRELADAFANYNHGAL
jgi:hypothetical protein